MRANYFLLWVAAASAFGQVTTGSISGSVFDPSGRVIRGATVTVTSGARSLKRTAVTDVLGYYKFIDLPPATYTLDATAASFGKSTSGDVTVAVDSSVRVDFKLQLAVATETISVNVRAIQADTSE